MTPRLAAALTAALLAIGAAPALAAPKTVCRLVEDASGDGTTSGQGPSRAALDIVSADVATGRRNLVAVVRLGSVDPDATLAGGVTYRFGWMLNGAKHVLTLVRYSDGTQQATYDSNTEAPGGTREVRALVDTATDSVTWTVPRANVPGLPKRGPAVRLTQLAAGTDPGVNVSVVAPGFTFSSAVAVAEGDVASSARAYSDLTPSCVKGV